MSKFSGLKAKALVRAATFAANAVKGAAAATVKIDGVAYDLQSKAARQLHADNWDRLNAASVRSEAAKVALNEARTAYSKEYDRIATLFPNHA